MTPASAELYPAGTPSAQHKHVYLHSSFRAVTLPWDNNEKDANLHTPPYTAKVLSAGLPSQVLLLCP